jgi:cyclase
MISKRIIIVLTFQDGVLFRTKQFYPDYRYTDSFVGNKDADEIVLIDVSKNKKNRNLFYKAIQRIAKSCFVPIVVGGHISTFDEISKLQDLGADRILVNSIIHIDEKLVMKITNYFGSQFVIGGIDCFSQDQKYLIFINHGKTQLKMTLKDCLKKFEKCKIGEILVQSIERDGSLRGFDNKLNHFVKKNTNIPVIACGGAGHWDHFVDAFNRSKIDGLCTNNIFHYSEKSLRLIKNTLLKNKIHVRPE